MTDTPIPFLDLVTPHRELEEELVAAFREAVRSAAFIGGAQVEAFEREFADVLRHQVLRRRRQRHRRRALRADGRRRRPWRRGRHRGAHVHRDRRGDQPGGRDTEFVDIDERTYCMSPQTLADYLESCATDPATGRPLGKRTGKPIKAIVPVHLYGQVADMDALLSDCRRLRPADRRGCLPGAGRRVSLRRRRLAAGRLVRQGRRVQLLSRARTSARAAKPAR